MALRPPRLLPDQILAEARERILSGRLAADAPIRQDALALELGESWRMRLAPMASSPE